MAFFTKTFDGARGMFLRIGTVALVIIGFFAILFTSTKLFRGSGDAQVGGVAHADAPTCATTCGDSGCGDSGSCGDCGGCGK